MKEDIRMETGNCMGATALLTKMRPCVLGHIDYGFAVASGQPVFRLSEIAPFGVGTVHGSTPSPAVPPVLPRLVPSLPAVQIL